MPGVEAGVDVLAAGIGGQGEDRKAWHAVFRLRGADEVCRLGSAQAGHFHVEQQDVERPACANRRNRRLAGIHGGDAAAGLLQHGPGDDGVDGVSSASSTLRPDMLPAWARVAMVRNCSLMAACG